jgi:hypothetical protein
MSAEGRMRVVALADDRARVDDAVAVVVAEPPERGSRSDEEVAVVMEHSPGDVVGGIRVEAFDHDPGEVRESVAVGVLNAIHAVLDLRKIPPVARTVLVEIGQPWILRAPLRRQLAPIEGQQVLH